jgi:FkbM family methyltransferase
MLSFIKRKIRKHIQKRTFQEYGYQINTFVLPEYGEIAYAQWLHPFESEKKITRENVAFFGRLLAEGSFCVDIGAHTGDTTVPMAVALGKKGKVLALEPNPYVYKILEKNASLNPDHGKIVPIPYAATHEPGVFTFHYSDASFCNGGFLEKIKNNRHNHNYTLDVEGIRLSDYLRENHREDLDRLSLVKVDAEGYDKEILKSIADILQACRPRVIAECYKRLSNEERSELYHALSDLGYVLFRLEDKLQAAGTAPATPLTEERMQEYRHFEIVALPTGDPLLPVFAASAE